MKSKLLRLKDKAWKVFSKWIRQRDKRCVTCGSIKSLQGGHFWHNILDFDEMNVNAQCAYCNHYLSGNLAVYSTYLIKKYGIEKFNELDIRHTMALKGEKRSELDYEKLYNHYNRLII